MPFNHTHLQKWRQIPGQKLSTCISPVHHVQSSGACYNLQQSQQFHHQQQNLIPSPIWLLPTSLYNPASILIFLNNVHRTLNNANCSQCDVIYLDPKKAFDSVPHQELLLKLWMTGIVGGLWKWFREYLSDRHQHVHVCINSCTSFTSPLTPDQDGPEHFCPTSTPMRTLPCKSTVTQEQPTSSFSSRWHGFKFVGDNVDENVKPRNQTLDRQGRILHYYHHFAVEDRIDFSSESEERRGRHSPH